MATIFNNRIVSSLKKKDIEETHKVWREVNSTSVYIRPYFIKFDLLVILWLVIGFHLFFMLVLYPKILISPLRWSTLPMRRESRSWKLLILVFLSGLSFDKLNSVDQFIVWEQQRTGGYKVFGHYEEEWCSSKVSNSQSQLTVLEFVLLFPSWLLLRIMEMNLCCYPLWREWKNTICTMILRFSATFWILVFFSISSSYWIDTNKGDIPMFFKTLQTMSEMFDMGCPSIEASLHSFCELYSIHEIPLIF